MNTAVGYKSYEKILDAASGSLAFTSWIAVGLLRGDVSFNPPDIFLFGGYPLFFFLIFFSGLLVTAIIMGVDILIRIGALTIKDERLRRIVIIVSTGFVAALILIGYTHLFFSRAGGWIVGGGRGLLGGLAEGWSGFLLEFVFYFFAALLARALLAAKKKLHRRFNMRLNARFNTRFNLSAAIFLVILLASLPTLYFIFFTVR